MRRWIFVSVSIVVLAAIALAAHVTIAPAESRLGATERYTVRVPTEGASSTIGVDVIVPDGVTVSYVLATAGWTSDLKREGGRIVSISWKLDVPPAHFAELVFNARNPKEGTSIAWKVKQRFADGTSRDWTPNTKLLPAGESR